MDEATKLVFAAAGTGIKTISVLMPSYSPDLVAAIEMAAAAGKRVNVFPAYPPSENVTRWTWDADPAPHHDWRHAIFRLLGVH